jgi:hypothetical protein
MDVVKGDKGLTALTPEMDCDRSDGDGLATCDRWQAIILVILVKFGCLGGISDMSLLHSLLFCSIQGKIVSGMYEYVPLVNICQRRKDNVLPMYSEVAGFLDSFMKLFLNAFIYDVHL